MLYIHLIYTIYIIIYWLCKICVYVNRFLFPPSLSPLLLAKLPALGRALFHGFMQLLQWVVFIFTQVVLLWDIPGPIFVILRCKASLLEGNLVINNEKSLWPLQHLIDTGDTAFGSHPTITGRTGNHKGEFATVWMACTTHEVHHHVCWCVSTWFLKIWLLVL